MMKRWKEKLQGKFARKRSRSLIGLDIGTTVIKAVEVTLNEEDQPVVTGVASRDLKPGEEVREALVALLEEAGFASKEVASAISGKSVIVRHLSTAEMTDEELAQAMRFEADKFLPFDALEVLMDCERLNRQPQLGGDEDDGQTETIGVALAACRNTVVEEQYRTLLSAGLTPVAVDAEVFALVNAYEFCNGELANTEAPESEEGAADEIESIEPEGSRLTPEQFAEAKARTGEAYETYDTFEENEEEIEDYFDPYTGAGKVDESTPPPLSGCAVAIADIGATRTQISVLIGGETCFSRDIGVGGADMTQAIVRRLSVDTEEAEQLKRIPGESEAEVLEALESVIDDLVGELSMSLDFVENHEGLTVGKILLAGGGAGTPGLLEAILASTECEVARWDLFENVKVDETMVDKEELEKHGATLAVAVGLAARVVAA
ncbi:MAG: Tfp pilus assembly PilM family ATPase [Bacteroidia bacterium]|jgi:Tfp pilus assembly PilM family ATPase